MKNEKTVKMEPTWKMRRYEYSLLEKYSEGKNFAIETGSGISTYSIAINFLNKGNFFTIGIDSIDYKLTGATYIQGWSVNEDDIIDTYKESSRYKDQPEEAILAGEQMQGKCDILRKLIELFGSPDFVFLDSGEYCGYAEWLIVKDVMKKGSILACHDIYYPKSIKCYRVLEDIEKSNEWKILEKTDSIQGLLIAERL